MNVAGITCNRCGGSVLSDSHGDSACLQCGWADPRPNENDRFYDRFGTSYSSSGQPIRGPGNTMFNEGSNKNLKHKLSPAYPSRRPAPQSKRRNWSVI